MELGPENHSGESEDTEPGPHCLTIVCQGQSLPDKLVVSVGYLGGQTWVLIPES